ncbi:MAG TPA: DUF3325 domain-containing protein [Polyangiaceae bacterium]|nr:DUF3325 domain-containing protein [Polyangiaceae bacterium]
MAEALLLSAAALCSSAGMGWLAVAMKPHWAQVRGAQTLAARGAVTLRVLGVLSLAASLVLCSWADHPSMAALVYVMTLTGSALLVALTLAWRPRLLSLLVVWMR